MPMLRRLEHRTVARSIALGILVVTLVGLMAYGVRTRWLPWMPVCDQNPSCHVLAGESLAALENARFFVADGLRYWLVQRHDIVGVQMVYLHNINLGAFVVYGTVLLGATSLTAAAVLSGVAFVIGLAYAYLFVEHASGSRRFALAFLLLFAGELYHNTLIGLNLLRAWHWLPLFGVAYHALVIARRRSMRVRDFVPLTLLAAVGMGTGYEIYAFVGGTAVWTMVLFGAGWRVRLWVPFLAAFAVPVLLRQVQTIGGVGFTIWATDLYYTAGAKSPLIRSVLPLPPPEQIDAWFQENLIFRGTPNNAPVSEALSLLVSSGRHLMWLNELGPITWLTALLGLVIAVVFFVRGGIRAPDPPAEGTPALRARTVLALFLGVATGFAVFGYHAWYYLVVVHQLPLIVAPICLTAAFVVSLLLDAAARPLPARALALAALALVFGERLYRQWANLRDLGLRAHPRTTRWGSFDVGPPGGMYGEHGPLVLGIAAVALAVVLCVAAYAFLRVRPAASSVQAPRREPSSRRSAPAEVPARLV